jgi:hypothetical protein
LGSFIFRQVRLALKNPSSPDGRVSRASKASAAAATDPLDEKMRAAYARLRDRFTGQSESAARGIEYDSKHDD